MACGALVASGTFAFSATAHEEEGPSRPECEGIHSLANPLPDSCLGPIDTDRPHQTDTPHVVPAGHTQYEIALGMVDLGGVVSGPSAGSAPRFVFFENMYKFGLVSNVDFQVIVTHAAYDTKVRRLEPQGPVTLRTKINVLREDGFVPALTFVPHLAIPMSPADGVLGGTSIFLCWDLPLGFEVEANVGAFVEAGKPGVSPLLASAITRQVVGPLSAYFEGVVFGQERALGSGLLLRVGRDVQLDAGSYVGLAGDRARATPFLGLSFRR
ncbi:MAG: hypothetical protein U0169_12055 [Polyangiaceae bacterium]